MISPEVLRRYPFFAKLNDAQLKAIAMLAEEVSFKNGQTIVVEDQLPTKLYLLIEGSVDLFMTVNESATNEPKQVSVGEVNPGEPFGISSMIDGKSTASVCATSDCRVIAIDAVGLRALCDLDCSLGYAIMSNIAQAYLERLNYNHTELAAARA